MKLMCVQRYQIVTNSTYNNNNNNNNTAQMTFSLYTPVLTLQYIIWKERMLQNFEVQQGILLPALVNGPYEVVLSRIHRLCQPGKLILHFPVTPLVPLLASFTLLLSNFKPICACSIFQFPEPWFFLFNPLLLQSGA